MNIDIITEGIKGAYTKTITALPNVAMFLLILLVGYLVAKVVSRLLAKGLNKAGLDRALERGGVKRAVERTGLKITDVVGTLIYYTIFLFVLQMAFDVFGTNQISNLLAKAISYLPSVFVAIVILVLGGMFASIAKEILLASLGALTYGPVIAGGTSIAIITVAIFAALNQLGIAQEIVNGLFYAVLAVFAGSAVVAIGGGGIVPMRARWERALAKLDEEAPTLQAVVTDGAAAATSKAEPVATKE